MLFKGHEDLLMEFVNFLPNCPESAPSAKKAVQRHKGTATSAMHKVTLIHLCINSNIAVSNVLMVAKLCYGHTSIPQLF